MSCVAQDLGLLRWVHGHGDEGTGEIPFHATGESAVLGVPQDQLDVALRRLEKYSLITGERIEATYVEWRWARPTADGLRVLGEWPPPASATVNEVLAHVVGKLADEQLQGEDATAARRVAGSIGRGATTIAADVVKGELRRAGEDLVS